MADGSVMAGSEMAGRPSAVAKMVCEDETKQKVAAMLGAARTPVTTTSYVRHRYTCTYRLSEGPLVLSVDDVTGLPAAQVALREARTRVGATRPITGLASLGLPGYESAAGAVVFRKDDKVLVVDARALPAAVGSHHLSRADVAYQVATDVLACWSGG